MARFLFKTMNLQIFNWVWGEVYFWLASLLSDFGSDYGVEGIRQLVLFPLWSCNVLQLVQGSSFNFRSSPETIIL